MSKLNQRRLAFALAYVECGNATESAIIAGYSEKTAKMQGSRLLTNDDIAAFIAEARDKAAGIANVSQADIIERLWEIATQNTDRGPAVSALSLLVKVYGMDNSVVRVETNVGIIVLPATQSIADWNKENAPDE